MLSPTELREQLTSGLDDLSAAEAHEEFSERLDDFLEQNNIEESEIISGESEYAPILSEAAFNDLDFRGMKGTGLSLADARRIMTDDIYRLEMAEDYLTGNAEERIEKEYTEYSHNPHSRSGMLRAEPLSNEGVEAVNEAMKTKEFMHYEMRDALNSGPDGLPVTLDEFYQDDDIFDWQQMLGDQAALHQNGGTDDLKFIHPDGREVVYDGDTKKLMTEDRYMGTYNYENATIPNDTTPGIVESVRNTQTEGSSLHKTYDVDTWVEMGNTRADRYENGGELGRQAQLIGSVVKGGVNSLGNDANDIGNAVSNKLNQAGEAIHDGYEAVKSFGADVARGTTAGLEGISGASNQHNSIDEIAPDNAPSDGFRGLLGLPPNIGKGFDGGSWQEGALNSNSQNMNGAHIQHASLSETVTQAGSGTVSLEDAIGILSADQKALNVSASDGQSSPVQDALNHPDAAQMFQNLHTHGVKTLTAEITSDMSPEDRVRELLISGQEATQNAAIPMPSEQRALEAAQEFNNIYEDEHSFSI